MLVGEALCLPVAQLVQVGVAGELDHGGGATHEDHAVIAGGGQVLLDHVCVDEALTVLPVWIIIVIITTTKNTRQ